jgi:thiol-disulfide isomerase/thioredoxin
MRAWYAAMVLVGAATASAADLRDVSDPARVMSVFPARADVRLLNVWATWCIPCVEEMPDLRTIDETFGPEVAIAGVSMDDMIPDARRESVTAFLDRKRVTFPNLYYTGLADDLASRLKFSGEIPITVMYDRSGREIWRHQGRIDKDKTIAEIRKVLARRQK